MLLPLALLSVIAVAFNGQPQAPPPALVVTCSASPNTVAPGGTVAITATGFSSQNRHMSYSFKTTSGRISPAGASAAVLHTAADAPATINVTCSVVDDRGAEASRAVTITVQRP